MEQTGVDLGDTFEELVQHEDTGDYHEYHEGYRNAHDLPERDNFSVELGQHMFGRSNLYQLNARDKSLTDSSAAYIMLAEMAEPS